MGMVSKIIQYEQGELGTWEVIELFSELIKNGLAWTLQGQYGRSAHSLIESGFLTADGDITDKAREELSDESIN
jgi:hypothetical protein